ncbi:piggyBac transposable element-derived protein 5 [Cricetulus griseus]|uniref:PiggyBac transposable element-derived protein 5 n=1 Tax=Cricetulus griseus TaxID=10029 RepID=A0A061IEU1_CRIGR|nr:piggyBac transposable element-derived protein 5 [Cricetulus griseus]
MSASVPLLLGPPRHHKPWILWSWRRMRPVGAGALRCGIARPHTSRTPVCAIKDLLRWTAVFHIDSWDCTSPVPRFGSLYAVWSKVFPPFSTQLPISCCSREHGKNMTPSTLVPITKAGIDLQPQHQVLHEPLIDEDPVFIATCTERELRKRKKRKFSLWVRQCSSTGFIIQIYVHLKEGGGPDGLDALKNKPQLHSMVARSLCRNAAGKNYIIFTGPSITSLTLFEEFEKQGIYCCGLLSSRKSDCTGLPQSMLTNPATPLARGQHQIRTKGNMSLICWYNKGHFRFLTNAYSPVQQGVIIKRRSGEIPCPLAVEAFAAHLSYICRYDDKYSKYFISHKPNKTWQQVFWFAISIAVNNAYILYKMSDAYHVKRYSRAQFGERLVRELLGLEDASPAH